MFDSGTAALAFVGVEVMTGGSNNSQCMRLSDTVDPACVTAPC